MSDRDFSGRFPGPVTGRPRRPLSIRASTASWSIRFSLRTMISGAPSSSSLFRRLLRLMIRRYRSFRSDVAKRPPSSCTIGRRSGGITGTASRIIHSGRFPDSRNASTTSSLLMMRALFCPVESLRPAFNSADSFSRSIAIRSSLMDSAPIPARKLFPNSSLASWYSFSVRTCLYCNLVSPASRTM